MQNPLAAVAKREGKVTRGLGNTVETSPSLKPLEMKKLPGSPQIWSMHYPERLEMFKYNQTVNLLENPNAIIAELVT